MRDICSMKKSSAMNEEILTKKIETHIYNYITKLNLLDDASISKVCLFYLSVELIFSAQMKNFPHLNFIYCCMQFFFWKKGGMFSSIYLKVLSPLCRVEVRVSIR